MLLALAVGLSMLAKDTLGTGVIVFLGRRRPVLAGACDALGDLAAVACYGVGGVEVVRHGASPATVAVLAAMSAGSLAGTITGFVLSSRVKDAP